jgi:hypothetical protein
VSDTRHQISILLDPDDRLVAAIGGAARYLADAAGLAKEVILQFQTSVISACKHCFQCHTSDAPCGITLRRSPDRLEVEVALPGTETPTDQNPSWEGIDEVHCENHDHAAILRLTKYVPPSPPAEESQAAS